MATRIESWNPEKGFGFARVDGRRVFIHCSVVSPRPARGTDLTGREVEVAGVEDGPKGRKATSVKLLPTAEELEIERRKEEEKRREREAEEERRREADARWEERRRQLASQKGSFERLRQLLAEMLKRPGARVEEDTDVDVSVSFPKGSHARAYIDGNGEVVEQGDTREFYWVPVHNGHLNFPDLKSLATYLRESGGVLAKIAHGYWSAVRNQAVEWSSWTKYFSREELGFPANPENFTFCTKCKTWYRKEDLVEKAWSQKWGAGVHVECPSGHLLDSRQEWIKEMPYRKAREEEPLEALHGLMRDD